MSWTIDRRCPHAADELEEAVLIAHDRVHRADHARPAVPRSAQRRSPSWPKPNLNMDGRTAGSPDNAQGTHFFLINDSGTYFLRKLPPRSIRQTCPYRRAC